MIRELGNVPVIQHVMMEVQKKNHEGQHPSQTNKEDSEKFAHAVEKNLQDHGIKAEILTKDAFIIQPTDEEDDGEEKWDEDKLRLYGSYDTQAMQTPPNAYEEHAWIYADGMHYDIEDTTGVKSFFDLAPFKHYIKGEDTTKSEEKPKKKPEKAAVQPDLRKSHDEKVKVDGGTLYRKGKVCQVWWDGQGEKGRETWNAPTEQQAKENYEDMKERWKETSGAEEAIAMRIKEIKAKIKAGKSNSKLESELRYLEKQLA